MSWIDSTKETMLSFSFSTRSMSPASMTREFSVAESQRELASASLGGPGNPHPPLSPSQQTAPVFSGRTWGCTLFQNLPCVDLQSCSLESIAAS